MKIFDKEYKKETKLSENNQLFSQTLVFQNQASLRGSMFIQFAWINLN